MTNFEKTTAAPEALAELLAGMAVLEGPWDNAFQREYCDKCQAKDCAASVCAAPELYQDEQKRIAWWLGLEADA